MKQELSNPAMSSAQVFSWNEYFESGITIIDEQHRQLVDLLNSLASHMACGSDEVLLLEVFNRPAAYVVRHFQTEEGIWKQYLPDELITQEHEQAYQDFVT